VCEGGENDVWSMWRGVDMCAGRFGGVRASLKREKSEQRRVSK
jgi:hypothetical protein